MRIVIAVFTISVLFLSTSVYAQNQADKPALKVYLSNDSSSYAGAIIANQMWTRFIFNNPDRNGVEQYGDFDLALRRSRLILYTYLMDRVLLYTQLGYDGQTYRSGKKPGINLHNAVSEYIFIKNKLHFGMGLHSWNGISRYSNFSFTELLVVDKPGFAYPLENTTSQFGSQIGIYARGNINKLNYRISASKPFEYGKSYGQEETTKVRLNENLSFKGYLSYQFFDKENSLLPYMTMNNLGRNKIFNVGVGVYYHPESMIGYWEGQSEISDLFLAGIDAFLDMPLKNKGAITSYLGYYYNFYGKDYLLASGSLNVSRMDPKLGIAQGHGNSQWETGTGHIARAEFGYLMPGEFLGSKLQPYGAATYKNFNALDEASVQFDIGANMLTYGNHIKWTLQYSTRPVYGVEDTKNIVTGSKGQITLQSQIWF